MIIGYSKFAGRPQKRSATRHQINFTSILLFLFFSLLYLSVLFAHFIFLMSLVGGFSFVCQRSVIEHWLPSWQYPIICECLTWLFVQWITTNNKRIALFIRLIRFDWREAIQLWIIYVLQCITSNDSPSLESNKSENETFSHRRSVVETRKEYLRQI